MLISEQLRLISKLYAAPCLRPVAHKRGLNNHFGLGSNSLSVPGSHISPGKFRPRKSSGGVGILATGSPTPTISPANQNAAFLCESRPPWSEQESEHSVVSNTQGCGCFSERHKRRKSIAGRDGRFVAPTITPADLFARLSVCTVLCGALRCVVVRC